MTALDKLIEAVEAGGDLPEIGHGYWQFLPAGACILAARTYHEGSLDDALALHEALLPGWGWGRYSSDGSFHVTQHGVMIDDTEGKADAPARAWLLAILRAYRSVQP